MEELLQKTREYLDYLEEHYNNVQKAWKIIQEKCDGKDFAWLYSDYDFGIIDQEIKNHDKTKLSIEEFVPYRKYFFPTKAEKKLIVSLYKKMFVKAWKHHKANNKHHWENWAVCEGDIGDLVHMICDWMAMGMKLGDTAKEYYEKNKDKIKLPEWAIKEMYRIFETGV